MEAFSDGVFAIAITLLVLDLAIHPPGSPLQQVLHIGRRIVAYLVSFLTIGAAWLGHTALTDRLERTDSVFLRLNLLLLLVGDVPAVSHRAGRRGPARTVERAGVRHAVRAHAADDPSSWDLPWTRMPTANTSTRRDDDEEEQKGTENFCPSSLPYAIAILIGLAFPGRGVGVPRDRGVSRRPVPRGLSDAASEAVFP